MRIRLIVRCCRNEYYILEKAHRYIRHKKRLGIGKAIAKKYCNVPRSVIDKTFKCMCQLKKKILRVNGKNQ